MFSWYWVADLCREKHIAFILGHAFYMRAIHGGKAKKDKIDSKKIAVLICGGMFPQAYVYPREMCRTRDLMRRRMHLMRKRSELLAHIQNTNSQYNLPEIKKNLRYASNREGIAERLADPSVQKSIELDLNVIGVSHNTIRSWFSILYADYVAMSLPTSGLQILGSGW